MKKQRTAIRLAGAPAICALLAGALFSAAFLHGRTAHASGIPDLLSALPPGAPTLFYLDLAAVRASGFYQHRPDREPITIPNQEYSDFVRGTGFDFEKDLDRVAIASWPAAPGNGHVKQTVAIADGRFDRVKIRRYAQQNGRIEHQDGREVFVFPTAAKTSEAKSSKTGSNWSSATFLSDNRIALVNGPSIAPVVHGGDPQASDPARERAERLDGAAVFAISRMPSVPPDFGGGGQSSQMASLARSLQWVTLAALPDGDDLRVSIEGDCDNPTDARQLQSAVELLRAFGRAALDSPKTQQSTNPATVHALRSLLSGADVTQSGERVRILFELTPDIFKIGAAANPQ